MQFLVAKGFHDLEVSLVRAASNTLGAEAQSARDDVTCERDTRNETPLPPSDYITFGDKFARFDCEGTLKQGDSFRFRANGYKMGSNGFMVHLHTSETEIALCWHGRPPEHVARNINTDIHRPGAWGGWSPEDEERHGGFPFGGPEEPLELELKLGAVAWEVTVSGTRRLDLDYRHRSPKPVQFLTVKGFHELEVSLLQLASLVLMLTATTVDEDSATANLKLSTLGGEAFSVSMPAAEPAKELWQRAATHFGVQPSQVEFVVSGSHRLSPEAAEGSIVSDLLGHGGS